MQSPKGLCNVSAWGDLLSTLGVCVKERERQTHRLQVDDGCLLLLTSWWIATGRLCKCSVQRMSGVRKVVSSFTLTPRLKTTANTSAFKCFSTNRIFPHMSSLYISSLNSGILEIFVTSKNTPAELSLASTTGFWQFLQEIYETRFWGSTWPEWESISFSVG